MNAQDYVKSLFKDYEETPALRDFMEEIQSNLEDRTANLQKKGLSEEEAFIKASTELGDISALADELCLKKRQEVYQDAYLGIQHYMNPPRVAAYVVFGSILVFGIIIALVSFFSVSNFSFLDYTGIDWLGNSGLAWMTAFGVILPFFVTSVMGFTFLGLTQETAALYPMSKKRATWYTAAAMLIAFALVLFPLIYLAVSFKDSPIPFLAEWGLIPALAAEIPFIIPGIGLLVFLCLTEKNRLKPWAAYYAAGWTERYRDEIHKTSELWHDPCYSARFGLFSGAIWVFAAGVFFALGFFMGFRYSWLVFIFAVALQLLLQALLFKPKSKNHKNAEHTYT
ncbi:MAG: permease prefix domain 1-containing protein [Treponema sp.]|jgi:hypothetical protein|nr:permease prefix domain 1-containing protein [Treponema sp.]